MTRWFLLCIALISLPIVTDTLVDYSFRNEHPDQNIGYSKQQVSSMDRLIDKLNGAGTAKKRHKILSGKNERAILAYLYGSVK